MQKHLECGRSETTGVTGEYELVKIRGTSYNEGLAFWFQSIEEA